jgi:peptide/nickel transport system substrate-binding protein
VAEVIATGDDGDRRRYLREEGVAERAGSRREERLQTERQIVLENGSRRECPDGDLRTFNPAISQRAAARTLRFVPQADLANFDPIWAGAYVVRNASAMVWDTLYGLDDKLVPQRQMVEAEGVSPDGLTWTFRLRPELKFHDGEPVLAKDAVASIHRWAARDLVMGKIENELTAIDDRTFRWVLKKPFPRMLLALGSLNTPCCFVMPARIAATDPFRQVNEYVGSGPMRYVRNEWVPGATAVFEKFAAYVPRQEPLRGSPGASE